MSRFFYTSSIDDSRVDFNDLNSGFSDIETAINTTKIANDQFSINAGRYRHLSEPGSIFLYTEKEGANLNVSGNGLTIATKDGSAWNRFNGLQIDYNPSLNYAGLSSERFPIGYICAEYEAHDFSDDFFPGGGSLPEYQMLGHNYQIAIMYKIGDSSPTWATLPGTMVRFGRLNAHHHTATTDLPIWSALQKNPYSMASSSWRPGSAYNCKALFTCAPLLGFGTTENDNLTSITSITNWSLAIKCGDLSKQRFNLNATRDCHAWDKARIWIVAEDPGATD
tara:strand:+ start:4640 stop:5479 length:840 start_codon:yes stop_codon:yes gene_type:complete